MGLEHGSSSFRELVVQVCHDSYKKKNANQGYGNYLDLILI